MMIENKHQRSIVILLANGFVEQETVACVEKMRANNLPVLLVGVSAGLVTGQHGLKIKPDYSLEEIKSRPDLPLPQMILFPNGVQTHLSTDPRIYRLVDDIVNDDGIVAAMATAEPFISGYVGDGQGRFQRQGGDTAVVFVERLVDVVV
jgi:putative intracellular protease/amidase